MTGSIFFSASFFGTTRTCWRMCRSIIEVIFTHILGHTLWNIQFWGQKSMQHCKKKAPKQKWASRACDLTHFNLIISQFWSKKLMVAGRLSMPIFCIGRWKKCFWCLHVILAISQISKMVRNSLTVDPIRNPRALLLQKLLILPTLSSFPSHLEPV